MTQQMYNQNGLAGNSFYQNLINPPKFMDGFNQNLPQVSTQVPANYGQSLATPTSQPRMSYPSMDTRTSLGKGGAQLTPGTIDPAMNGLSENRTFFDPNATHLDNIGAMGNLAVSGLGLVGMFKNLKAQDLNYENAKTSMEQQTEAYNDRKDAKDRTRKAIAAANAAYGQ